MHIRRLQLSDTSEVAVVVQRMEDTLVEVLGEDRGRNLTTRGWREERVLWHLRKPSADGFIAVVDGEIAGHILVRVEDGIGRFGTIQVAPAFRRRGVASALVAAGEAWMAERGCSQSTTWTADDNRRLHVFFGQRGYRTVVIEEPGMVELRRTL